MASPEHSRLLTQAARTHLAPLGFRQKGRSRLWFCDHGWWAAVVEFQPSAWGKGSYLNVGAMWLWHPSDHWVFNEFERAAPFQEFQDGAQFADVASALAEQAAAQALALRERFSSIEAVAAHLAQKTTSGIWVDYHAAISASLAGDFRAASSHFGALAANPEVDAPEWVRETLAHAERLSASCVAISSAREAIGVDVTKTRKSLGLPEWSMDWGD